MMLFGIQRPVCTILAILMGVSEAFAQAPQTPTQPAAAVAVGTPLSIGVIEGNNAVNSIPRLHCTSPVVEVRDQNEFPVEGATVVFALPDEGPGGTFLNKGTRYSTRSDAHGQATAPFLMNNAPGKFEIKVTATAGNRRGEAIIPQTNSLKDFTGTELQRRSRHKRWPLWVVIGGVAATGLTVWVVSRGSGSSPSVSSAPTPITITPGSPVFH